MSVSQLESPVTKDRLPCQYFHWLAVPYEICVISLTQFVAMSALTALFDRLVLHPSLIFPVLPCMIMSWLTILRLLIPVAAHIWKAAVPVVVTTSPQLSDLALAVLLQVPLQRSNVQLLSPVPVQLVLFSPMLRSTELEFFVVVKVWQLPHEGVIPVLALVSPMPLYTHILKTLLVSATLKVTPVGSMLVRAVRLRLAVVVFGRAVAAVEILITADPLVA